MAQILINIPDFLYKQILKKHVSKATIARAFQNGKVLPKGHGRLIDADKFLKDNEAYTGWILNSSEWGGENAYEDTLEDLVNEATTIIEADKEGKE